MNHTAEPRLGSRSLFPHLTAQIYLNHSAISPLSQPVQERLQAVALDYAREGLGAYFIWREEVARLKSRLAALLGVTSSTEAIALTPNTTFGVMATALCYPWEAGDRVVVFRGEFPTNVTPWQQAAVLHGLEVTLQEVADFGTGLGLERLEAVLKEGRVRVVAVSAVQFQTGLRMPLEAMAHLCHAHGATLFVDAIQAVGIIPIDVEAMGIDVLTCGSHKWLMGPEGCGFLYIKPALAKRFRPHLAGWLSHEEPVAFLSQGAGHLRYDRPIRAQADFLEAGAANMLGLCALSASVELLQQLDVATIYPHVSTWLDALEPAMVEMGFVSQRSPHPEQRSGILSFAPPPGYTAAQLSGALSEHHRIACSTPDGLLRFAPHWPNHHDEVPQVIHAISQILA
ncbi:MAG: aminotransferase class V-fold PLP-dependent enzyme [Myxococcota bacterium]